MKEDNNGLENVLILQAAVPWVHLAVEYSKLWQIIT